MFWHSERLNLSPASLSLKKLNEILNQSQKLQERLGKLNKTLAESMIKTITTGDKLVGPSSQIGSDTAHHWWDIFSGYPPSAEKTSNILVHPLLILLAFVIILTVLNYWLCYKLKKLAIRVWALPKATKHENLEPL